MTDIQRESQPGSRDRSLVGRRGTTSQESEPLGSHLRVSGDQGKGIGHLNLWLPGSSGGNSGLGVEPHRIPSTVFTIGYERRQASELVADLAAAGIDALVDVRELPLSRRVGFSKTALRTAVEHAGIDYIHERAVGNPKPLRDAWKAGDVATGSAGYVAHLNNGSRPSVDALADRVAQGAVCLLCVEHDPSDCHRSLLVDALRERLDGLRVKHL